MYNKLVLLFYFVLCIGIAEISAQQFTIQVKSDCQSQTSNSFINPDELQADFIGLNTFGEAPLSVKFIDQSSGNPIKWKWQFGDGSSDTVPTMIHVYDAPGVYTVRLTIYNDTDSASFKQINYVRVAASGGCDSLNYPLPGGEYALYSLFGIGSGYISGNNSYGTRALASYFDDFEEGSELMAANFNFGFAEKSLSNNVPIIFKVWDTTGTSGSPGYVIKSVEIPVSSVVEDFEFARSTQIIFDEPLLLDGPFFIGVELPQVYGDTLALYTNYDGESEVGNGWRQDSLGNWLPYSDTQWGLDIDNAIFPVVCQPVGVEDLYVKSSILLYPIPSSENINFSFTDGSTKVRSVSVLDMTGRLIKHLSFDNCNSGIIKVSSLSEGFYFLRFETSAGVINKKIIVRH